MARYFNSQLVNPVSMFVPEPLELYQNRFDNMQKRQDTYKQSVDALNADWQHLPNDTTFANETNKTIKGKLASLQNLNANDPNSREKITSGISDVRKDLSSFGDAGVQNKKALDYLEEKKAVEKQREKDPLKANYRLYQLEQNAYNPDKAIKKGANGYENTKVDVPTDFEYKDPEKYTTDFMDKIESDSKYVGTGLRKSIIDYKYGNLQGEEKERTKQKIYDAMIPAFAGDLNLVESAKAERFALGDKNNLHQEENFFTQFKGKDGQVHYAPNPNTLLGAKILGAGTAREMHQENLNETYTGDAFGLHKAETDQANEGQQKFTTETGATESGGDWAKIAGLGDYFNEDGSIKASGKTLLPTVPGLGGVVANGANNVQTTSNLKSQVEEGLSKLYEKTSKLGLNVTRPDGSLDGAKTKENAINYFKGLSVYSNYTVAIDNPTLVNNLSNSLFGKTTNIHNMEIYDQGNPDSKAKYETPESKEKFKNSKVIGLDYTATQPGALKFVAPNELDSDGKSKAGDTPYIAISRNKSLQEQMKPIQELTTKSIAGARTGDVDKAAQTLTSFLKGTNVKDSFGHDIKLEQLGIPVASSRDQDGTLYVSYLDNTTGTPMIQVMKKAKNKPVEIKSLDEIQQDKTGEIFNRGGALEEFQRQSSKQTNPSIDFQED